MEDFVFLKAGNRTRRNRTGMATASRRVLLGRMSGRCANGAVLAESIRADGPPVASPADGKVGAKDNCTPAAPCPA
jgi:hypothetical protein